MVDALPGSARDRLESFHRLLAGRAVPQGMISAADAPRLWERHIVDSVRGAACLPERTATVVDIGSGAGLPGIPVAISRPDLSVYLVEPRARRAAFLELTVDTLKLSNVRVVVRGPKGSTWLQTSAWLEPWRALPIRGAWLSACSSRAAACCCGRGGPGREQAPQNVT